jgi:hydrogenase maturation protease
MDRVQQVAEAVLYEGYLLYPYTRTALKNQQRWTFGGVYPRTYSEVTGGNDPWLMQTQCLVTGGRNSHVDITVRFLHIVRRAVERTVDGSSTDVESVDELWVNGEVYRPWEEAIEREVTTSISPPADGMATIDAPIDVAADHTSEPLVAGDGTHVGYLVRSWENIQGTVSCKLGPMDATQRVDAVGESLYRLTVQIRNTTPWMDNPSPRRDEVIPHSMISTHTIVRVREGTFVSLLEPPPEYREAAAQCENIKTWPVLIGEHGERHTMLSSPIILYDYPEVSSQSKGNYFDATEIDELLAISVMTLSDDEKRQVRESDPRGREILERTESLTPNELMNLHGLVRGLQEPRERQ